MSKKHCSELLTKKMSSNQESEYFIPVKKEALPVTTSTMKAPPVKSPHNCEAILRDADPPISVSSEQLRSGVFLKPTKQVYIVFYSLLVFLFSENN